MLYQVAIYVYLVGVAIASCFSKKVKKMWKGDCEAIGILRQKVDPEAKYVWVHAASLGEFEQGRPLIERIRKDYPDYKVLLTFFSPSGYEVRKNYEGADIVTYLPIDTLRNAKRFLNAVNPVMAFFIKYEFWYNYLHILKKRGIPVYSVSSIFREGQIFFRWYGKSYANVLRCITHFFVQNEESRRLLANININNNVTIAGDTRFDRVLEIAAQAKNLDVVRLFSECKPDVDEQSAETGKSRVFVAGSSWQPDEEIFIPYFNEHHREWKLIIAPHVVSDDHIAKIKELLKDRNVMTYTDAKTQLESDATEASKVLRAADVLIINCYGLLSSIYQYGEVAYVGGGFGVGIHNLPEAAVWGMPVFFGPNNKRFQEAQDLKVCGGGMEIIGADSFFKKMEALVNNDAELRKASEAARNYVVSKAGALDKVMKTVTL